MVQSNEAETITVGLGYVLSCDAGREKRNLRKFSGTFIAVLDVHLRISRRPVKYIRAL